MELQVYLRRDGAVTCVDRETVRPFNLADESSMELLAETVNRIVRRAVAPYVKGCSIEQLLDSFAVLMDGEEPVWWDDLYYLTRAGQAHGYWMSVDIRNFCSRAEYRAKLMARIGKKSAA